MYVLHDRKRGSIYLSRTFDGSQEEEANEEGKEVDEIEKCGWEGAQGAIHTDILIANSVICGSPDFREFNLPLFPVSFQLSLLSSKCRKIKQKGI